MLFPNDGESNIVRRILEECVRLESVGKVCEELNQAGLRTRSRVIGKESGNPRAVGGTPFRPDTIRSLLQNPIYIGLIRRQGETHQGRHEPLVSLDLWGKANALLTDRRSVPSRSSHDQHIHLLKGVIRRADCGSTMTPYPSGKSDKDAERYLYHVCTAVIRNHRGSPCRVRRPPVRRLEQAVVQILSSLGDSPEVLRACLRMCRRRSESAA